MIDYSIEFTKGILFIRLCGVLNRFNEKDIQNDIFEIIKSAGIRYLVYNLEDLTLEEDVELFYLSEYLIKENDGKMIICGDKNNILSDNFDNTIDELSALKVFETC